MGTMLNYWEASIGFVARHVFPHRECEYDLVKNSEGIPEGHVIIKKERWLEPVNADG